MPRSRAVAVLTCSLLALPSAAAANPTITVANSLLPGDTNALPLTARHVLTLTAGATPERVTASMSPAVRITVAGATVTPPTSTTGPSLTTCPGRWNRMHSAYDFATPPQDRSTFTIAAGQTATVTADVTLIDTPYNEETLDAEWLLEVGQGRPFSVSSGVDVSYEGPLAVELAFRTIRLADGSYVVAGTAGPDVERGRVELWGYPPRRSRAVRLARVGVSQGEWTYKRWRPDRRGEWELYARYSGGGREYANSTSECGTPMRVR